ncbi:MAG: sel1 repeat family protein, partial [Proteobacteria bacterium]|nr:sel1 repeat family protein [Pseudomonadota bacterium]
GKFYKDGIVVKQDYTKTFKLFKLAAKQKSCRAYAALGELYERGLGVRKNQVLADSHYQNAIKVASKDDPCDQACIAALYYYGKGVDKDLNKAFRLSSEAAEENVTRAQLALGVMHRDGKGATQDYQKDFSQAWSRT